jgi:hypothetical protein
VEVLQKKLAKVDTILRQLALRFTLFRTLPDSLEFGSSLDANGALPPRH